ncbi:MAG: Holliday junction resolvase RuvX [Planctomycetes bacterium]|nr:Holliday junction resolvase RuvX [Planctomycetota bacterium]
MSVPPSDPIPTGRVAGIDYGRRRIGVAVCDAARIIASPLCVLDTEGDREVDGRFFRKLAAEERLAGFVIGLPIHADGSASGMSAEVERFGAWLGGLTGLPIAYQDERYTSREAADMLAGVGLSRAGKRRRSDAVAAQVVLTSWLERAAAGGSPDPGGLEA